VWEIGPLPDLIEDPAVFDVAVEFGTLPRTTARSFKLHVEPLIRLTAGAFRATVIDSLVMTIKGGTAPYQAVGEALPDGVGVLVTGSDVHVELAPDGPSISPPRNFVIVVTDASGKRGRRTVELERISTG
jgi:hypothetical protein